MSTKECIQRLTYTHAHTHANTHKHTHKDFQTSKPFVHKLLYTDLQTQIKFEQKLVHTELTYIDLNAKNIHTYTFIRTLVDLHL